MSGEETADSLGALQRLLESKGWEVKALVEVAAVPDAVAPESASAPETGPTSEAAPAPEATDPVQVFPVAPTFTAPENSSQLTPAALATLTEQLGQVALSGLPLEAGLRTLAEENTDWRIRGALREICGDLEQGIPLETSLAARQQSVPRHLLELIRAGLRTAKFGQILERYVQMSRRSAEVRAGIRLALSYPLILWFTATVILGFVMILIVPTFKEIFVGFNTTIPLTTRVLIGMSDLFTIYWFWTLSAVLAVVGVGAWLYLMMRSTVFGRRVFCKIPLIGPLYRLSALAELAHLLGEFVENRLPLPEALELAGSGCGDLELERGCRAVANEVRHGVPLADTAATLPHLPHGLRQILRWADQPQQFAESLYGAAEMFQSRARLHAAVFVPFFEPLSVLIVAPVIGFIVIALFQPLIHLLDDLS